MIHDAHARSAAKTTDWSSTLISPPSRGSGYQNWPITSTPATSAIGYSFGRRDGPRRQDTLRCGGLDLSSTQIAFASDVLQAFTLRVHLFESPMDVNPGLPVDYFDMLISIYGLGWTTDLPTTLSLVSQYLKPGGHFIFNDFRAYA